ncbi:MAG: hypothetical protein U9N52_14275 [Campylobacterota bacterium]|nr:hypothetical protein [Campylobacterota bacterium]
MKRMLLLVPIVFLLLFNGCGKIEDETAGSIEFENENYEPSQNNTCFSDQENSAGCFGTSQFFGDERVYEGYWSLYGKSDNYKLYYDKYLFGYDLLSDGTLKQRLDTQGYYFNVIKVWGLNNDGSKLTIHPSESYTISSKLTGSCYKVSAANAETYRMCQEDAISEDTLSNDAGYYGSDLKFGNNTYGDYEVVGQWTVNGVTVELFAEGNTSNGTNWGLSSDSKRITIDGVNYLAYRYPDNSCIETLIMQGDFATDKVMLCKL